MELEKFGWNLATIGFSGTIFFTLVSAWGLWQQAGKIWRNKSGQSVSVFWFSYNLFLFTANVIYGFSLNSTVLIFNGTLSGLMHIPILIGLAKFKGLKRQEKLAFPLYAVLLLLMIVLSQKEIIYLLFSGGNVLALAAQPYEIMKKKNSGMVEVNLLAIYLTSTIFWVIYAFTIKSLALEIICPIYLILLSITLILWRNYKV